MRHITPLRMSMKYANDDDSETHLADAYNLLFTLAEDELRKSNLSVNPEDIKVSLG